MTLTSRASRAVPALPECAAAQSGVACTTLKGVDFTVIIMASCFFVWRTTNEIYRAA